MKIRLAAAGLALALVTAACSTGDSAPPGTVPERPAAATTTTTTETIPAGRTTVDTIPLPGGVDPDSFDIRDGVWDGLGDPRIDVTHQDVTLTIEKGSDRIEGTVDIALRPRTDASLRSFTLDLRGPVIEEATIDGAPAEVLTDGHAAQVEIVPAEPLEPGGEVVVSISYGGVPADDDFPLGLAGIGWLDDASGGSFTLSQPDGTSTWVPVNDHPSDKATWAITIDAPAELTGVSNGILESIEEADGRRVSRWEMRQPIPSYVVLVAIGRYRIVEREGPDGLPVVLAISERYPASVDDLFDEIDDILGFFSETFGPYPFESSGAIVVDVPLGVALETATRPLFGEDSVVSDRVWALGHELAHEWWGNSVTVEDWADLWLNEGFATYADWLYEEHTGLATIDEQIGWSSPPSRLAVTDPAAAGSFSRTVYDGGAIALHALRTEIGDDRFFELLRGWHAENVYENVTTDDFVAFAEDASGIGLADWRRTWLDSAPQPERP